MQVEVDQSGKIGDTSVDTVVAFADGTERAILIPAHVKRQAIQELRALGKRDRLYYLLFATALFLLLQADIDHINQVMVDIEYRGKNEMIREHLLNLLQRAGKNIDPDCIQFTLITKQSPAHRVAARTLRGQRKPDHIVALDELLGEFA